MLHNSRVSTQKSQKPETRQRRRFAPNNGRSTRCPKWMLFNAARIVCGLLTRRRGILYLLMSQLILLKMFQLHWNRNRRD